MKVSLKLLAGTSCALAVFASAVTSAKAWNYTGTGQWASVTYGDWTIYQNEWGSSEPATLYANSASEFASSANWTGSGTKGYPHSQLNVDVNLNPYSDWASTGFNTLSNPSNGQGNWFFDVWTEGGDELMIIEWDNNTGSWGTQISGGVTIANHYYSSVYFVNGAWNGSGFHNVVIFSPGSNSTSESGLDLMAFLRWADSKGCLTNSRLQGWDWGVEPTVGNGTWYTNGFWGSWGSSSSSSGYSSNISNGNHAVVPQCATNARLDANGWSGSNGAKVQIWNGGTQTWAFTNKGSGIYQIAEAWNTGACLDVSGGGGSGTITQIWSCWGGSPQQWGAKSDGGNIYEFEPQCALGTRLDVWGASSSNGAQVAIYNANGGSNQKWAVN